MTRNEIERMHGMSVLRSTLSFYLNIFLSDNLDYVIITNY